MTNLANLDEKLICLINKPKILSFPGEIGLQKGNMGRCVYFYKKYSLGSLSIDKKRAEFLLEKVYQGINMRSQMDIREGVTGVGFGIAYLIQNHLVKGDLNLVLKDIDDLVYKRISFISRSLSSLEKVADRLNNVLLYAIFRARTIKDKDVRWLYENFVIELINVIYRNHSPYFYTEPLPASSNYQLAQFLYALVETHKLGFYNFRVEQIIKEMSMLVFTQIPLLHTNRLILYYVVDQLCKEIENAQWNEYAFKLRSQISLDEVLYKEMKDRNVYFTDGIGGVYLLLLNYNSRSEQPFTFSHQTFYDRIMQSEVWDLLERDEKYFEEHACLDGYLGLILLLDYMEKIHNCG